MRINYTLFKLEDVLVMSYAKIDDFLTRLLRDKMNLSVLLIELGLELNNEKNKEKIETMSIQIVYLDKNINIFIEALEIHESCVVQFLKCDGLYYECFLN